MLQITALFARISRSGVTAITAHLSVRFLVHYFQTRTLTPFAIYCLVFGAASILRFAS